MALNSNTLGTALYNIRTAYSNKTEAQLITAHGNIENARLQMCKDEAAEIINHITANAEGRYQAGTLVAGAVPVTATALPITVKIY
jgi:hypothetical protein